MSRLANASAAVVYSVAFVASPFLVASSAMRTACCVLELIFSSSSIFRVSRSSVCFWLAMTLAACSLSRRCCSCDSMIACSSWTLGSAVSSNFPVSAAVRYFQVRLMSLNMRGSLRPPQARSEGVDLFCAKCDHSHTEHHETDDDADPRPHQRTATGVRPDARGHE